MVMAKVDCSSFSRVRHSDSLKECMRQMLLVARRKLAGALAMISLEQGKAYSCKWGYAARGKSEAMAPRECPKRPCTSPRLRATCEMALLNSNIFEVSFFLATGMEK